MHFGGGGSLATLFSTHPNCKPLNLAVSIAEQIDRAYFEEIEYNHGRTPHPLPRGRATWHKSYYTFDYKLETDKITDPREFIKLVKEL
jgi:hypothetical protein